MRLLNLIVAAALILAAGYVYKSKFAATVEAARVAKLRIEIARERDRIAMLRAESAKLEAPARIEGLAQRHLPLKPLDLEQIDTIDAVPFRPIEVSPRPADEPAIAKTESAPADAASRNVATGSIPTPPAPPAAPPRRPTASAIASRPAAPPRTSRPAPNHVASRSTPSVTNRAASYPIGTRRVSPVIVRRPGSAPVAGRPATRPVTRYAAPAPRQEPLVAPLRPPADVWTSEPANAEPR